MCYSAGISLFFFDNSFMVFPQFCKSPCALAYIKYKGAKIKSRLKSKKKKRQRIDFRRQTIAASKAKEKRMSIFG